MGCVCNAFESWSFIAIAIVVVIVIESAFHTDADDRCDDRGLAI